jgi:type IV secretion system protein VirB10
MKKKGNNEVNFEEDDLNQPEIDTGLSEVAISPKKNALIIGMVGLLSVILIYYIFFKESDEDKKKKAQNLPPTDISKLEAIKPASAEADIPIPVIPQLPAPPPLVAPTPPAPPPVVAPTPVLEAAPPPPSIPASLPSMSLSSNNDSLKVMEARKKSGIMMGGGGGGANSSDSDKTKIGSKTMLASFATATTSASQSTATTIGAPNYIIAQGKVIDVVLETAINTDLPGVVRAMVSRDVYAEVGKNILIPKGSRIIGSYASGIQRGQRRLAIKWQRVIRPDGIDLMIENAEGVDKLGRSGIEGVVDNKYFETISNAVLLSILNVGLAIGSSKITNTQQPTTSVTNNTASALGNSTSTSTTSTPTGAAIQEGLNNLGNVTKQITQDALKVTPTITIDQGTLMKVFVNQDLVFSPRTIYRSQVVQ